MEETGVPREIHLPVASHFELTDLVLIGTDCTGSCSSNYHTITTTTRLYPWVEYTNYLSLTSRVTTNYCSETSFTSICIQSSCGRDRMVVGATTTCAIRDESNKQLTSIGTTCE
jgi:hypothetical protein